MKKISGFILLEQIVFNLIAGFILSLTITSFMKYDVFLNQMQVKIFQLYQVLGTKIILKSWSNSMVPLYCRKDIHFQDNDVSLGSATLLKIFKDKGYIYFPETHWRFIQSQSDLDNLEEGEYLLFKNGLIKIILLEFMRQEKTPFQIMKIRKQYFSFHDGKFLIGKYPQIVTDGFKMIRLGLSKDFEFQLQLDKRKWNYKICTSVFIS